MKNIDSNLNIIKVQKNDMMNIFELSNDFDVRKSSFSTKKISLRSHKRWFEEKINRKDSFFYVVRVADSGKFIGYIRFDKKNKNYIITVHLKKDFRGKGIGTYLIRKMSCYLLKKYKGILIYAYIKCENIASLRSFEKVGYRILDKRIIKKSECFRLELDEKNLDCGCAS